MAFSANSQVTSVDPELLALQNSRQPKEYTIRHVIVSGLTTLDTSIVRSISGIRAGDKVILPGGDLFFKINSQPLAPAFFQQCADLYYCSRGN